MARIILFNKPFGVICQFSRGALAPARPTLADFIKVPGVYPAGRLDTDSEGLLLLTDDGLLQARVTDPKRKLPQTYWAQVEGDVGAQALHALRAPIDLGDFACAADRRARRPLAPRPADPVSRTDPDLLARNHADRRP